MKDFYPTQLGWHQLKLTSEHASSNCIHHLAHFDTDMKDETFLGPFSQMLLQFERSPNCCKRRKQWDPYKVYGMNLLDLLVLCHSPPPFLKYPSSPQNSAATKLKTNMIEVCDEGFIHPAKSSKNLTSKTKNTPISISTINLKRSQTCMTILQTWTTNQ